MKTPARSLLVSRRSLLGGFGTGGAALLLRPLIAEAEQGPPVRFLALHRPSGTITARFAPTGTETDFQFGEIAKPFEPYRSTITTFQKLLNPRTRDLDPGHKSGMIMHMTGTTTVSVGADVSGNAPSVDQFLVEKSPLIGRTPIPSLQFSSDPSGVCTNPSGVMSYSGPKAPLYPICVPSVAYAKVFGVMMPGGATPDNAATLASARARKQSVLDFLKNDLSRLHGRVPASQRPKLDAHLEAIRGLERGLEGTSLAGAIVAAGTCKGATAALGPLMAEANALSRKGKTGTGAMSDNYAQHLICARAQMAIIRTAFQCDLTRVATFSYDNGGGSEIKFAGLIPGLSPEYGHHRITHQQNDDYIAAADRWYSERVAEYLGTLKAIPEANGTTLLDNMLIYYFSDVGDGHGGDNVPVLVIGGAGGKHKGGKMIRADVKANTTVDILTSIANAFGVPIPQFGEKVKGTGPMPGLMVS